MPAVFIVAIVFGSIVLAIAIISSTILTSIKLRHGGLSQSARKEQNQEAEMIQEIYHGLESLEKRLEALETILMDRTRKDV